MHRSEVEEAMAPLGSAFAADGLNLSVGEITAGRISLIASWAGEACPSCLLPQASMEALFLQAFKERGLPVTSVTVLMPA